MGITGCVGQGVQELSKHCLVSWLFMVHYHYGGYVDTPFPLVDVPSHRL